MNRYYLRLAVVSVLLAVLVAGAQRPYSVLLQATAPTALSVPLARVTVDVAAPGAAIPSDFAGLSLEYSAVGGYLGMAPASPNRVFRRLLANLGHGSLRIGGDSEDTSCWATAGGPVWKGCTFTFGPALPRVVFATAAATGWRALMGLNLAQDNPAAALGYVTEGILPIATPRTLLGLEIGNEPDLYGYNGLRPPSYSLAQYLREFNGYVALFRRNARTQRLPLVGPAFITTAWQQRFGAFLGGVGADHLAFTTLHYYPFSNCSAFSSARATIANLLAESTMSALSSRFSRYAAEARSHGLAVQMDENNSVSCHGKAGVSDSFASALWGLDLLFTLARAGLARANFHIYDLDGSPGYYNPIASRATRTSSGTWTYANVVHPLYDAMLLFSRAEGRRFLPVAVGSRRANVTAYAVADGRTVQVFLLNKDLRASGSVVIAPSRALGPATVTVLRAPSLSATTGTTLGGQVVDPHTGLLPRPRTQTVAPDRATGAYTIPLPTASAAVVELPLHR